MNLTRKLIFFKGCCCFKIKKFDTGTRRDFGNAQMYCGKTAKNKNQNVFWANTYW